MASHNDFNAKGGKKSDGVYIGASFFHLKKKKIIIFTFQLRSSPRAG